MLDALTSADLDRPGDPLLDRAEAAFTHPRARSDASGDAAVHVASPAARGKRRPAGYRPRVDGATPARNGRRARRAGHARRRSRCDRVRMGQRVSGRTRVDVPAFRDRAPQRDERATFSSSSSGRLSRCAVVARGGLAVAPERRVEHPLFWERADGDWFWRGMFDLIPLPPAWPVYVSHAEARAYARWRGAVCRPRRSSSEPHIGIARANGGASVGRCRHRHRTHGVFDFTSWDPEPAGSHPAGRSAWGVEDLVGNGWEWTSTSSRRFRGFGRWPRIRSTPPISSTASTWS